MSAAYLESSTTSNITTDFVSSQGMHEEGNLEQPPAISRGERQLPVFCPQCGTRIEIHKGLCGNRLIDAILLQAERLGTELECQRCQTRFVFQKLEEIPVEKRHRTRQQALSAKY